MKIHKEYIQILGHFGEDLEKNYFHIDNCIYNYLEFEEPDHLYV